MFIQSSKIHFKFLTGILLTLVVLLAGCSDTDDITATINNPIPTAVRVTPVVRSTFTDTVTLVGQVTAAESVTVSPKRNGRVAEVWADEGMTVTKGTPLLRLESAGLTGEAIIALAQSRLSVTTAKDALINTRKVTTESVNSATTAVHQTQASLSSALLNLENTDRETTETINQIYETAKRTLDTTLLTLTSSLEDLNMILGVDIGKETINDSFEQYLGALDQTTLQIAEDDFHTARAIQLTTTNLGPLMRHGEIDKALTILDTALRSATIAATSTDAVLVKTVTSNTYTPAMLTAHINSVNAVENNLNASLIQIESSQQAIRTAKIARKDSLASLRVAIKNARASVDGSQARLAVANASADQNITAAANALQMAEQALLSTQVRYEPLTVVAPRPGVIVARRADPGESVTVATPLFEIAEIDTVKITIEVTERIINKIALGDIIPVTTDITKKIFLAKVTRRDLAADPATHTFTIELTLDNTAQLLLPGMLASTTITVAEKPDVIIIPTSAVLTDIDTGESAVFVSVDGVAQKRPVTLGMTNGKDIIITTGLTTGELLITTGADFLDDEEAILIIE